MTINRKQPTPGAGIPRQRPGEEARYNFSASCRARTRPGTAGRTPHPPPLPVTRCWIRGAADPIVRGANISHTRARDKNGVKKKKKPYGDNERYAPAPFKTVVDAVIRGAIYYYFMRAFITHIEYYHSSPPPSLYKHAPYTARAAFSISM